MSRTQKLDNLNLLADIQEKVESLSEANYNDCISLILNSPLFQTDYSSISRIVYFASRSRPLSISLLIKLATNLCAKSENFKKSLLEDLFSFQYPNAGRYYFLFSCFESGLFTLDAVSEKLDKLFIKNEISLANQLFVWFAPELESSNQKLFEKFKTPSEEQLESYGADIRNFWGEYDSLKADDWKILKERRKNGFNPHELIPIFLKDDAAALKNYIDSQNQKYNPNSNDAESENKPFDSNQIILASCYDRCCNFQNRPTLLCCAAYLCADHCCHVLVENGADIKGKDRANRTPVVMAIAGGASKALIDFLSDPDDERKQFRLLIAASNHRNEYIQEHYSNLEQNAREQNYGGILHQAAGTNNIKAALIVIGKSENVNIPNQANETPLHYASKYGNIGMIDLLLSFDSTDINALTDDNDTPCHLALDSSSYSAAKRLIENPKMNPLIKNDKEMTVFHLVIAQGYTDLFNMIMEKCPDLDVNMLSFFNRTPLILSLMYQSLDIAKLLLQNPKINVNLAEDSGRTPLHLAILLRNMEIINLLLDKPDIDLTATECYKLTAYDYAVRIKYQEGIDRLKPLMPPPPPEEPKQNEETKDADQNEEKNLNEEKKDE